ncbi:hypothetical protein [Chelativorans sp.]|uniref:hypothetical protein n=1 Tax=Chelativorans sp. TaxID=2203393 RepID=UPI002811A672|nr:hypothetical protein [Chelativorans sp.]
MNSRLVALAAAAAAALLSGCAGPTYGTGKPADQQLVEDLTGVLSVTPKRSQAIDYSPRPGIVKPPSTEVLPPPQENVVAAGNPAWPESPEQRLARIRAEATANQDNPSYRPPVIRDVATGGGSGSGIEFSEGDRVRPAILASGGQTQRQQGAAFRQQRQASQQGSPTTRRYLSEPPLDYRQPAPTAPADQLGEDEAKKQRAAKRAAGGAETGGLRRLIPWLN